MIGLRACLFIVMVAASAGCGGADDATEESMNRRPIEAVLSEHAPELMDLEGVAGIYQGLCDEQPCLVIMVVKDTAELRARLPIELEGYRVRIEETGVIRPLGETP